MMMMMMRAVRYYSSSSSSSLRLKKQLDVVAVPRGGIVRVLLSAVTTTADVSQPHQYHHQYQYQYQYQQKRNFHFGTREYAACFENLPRPDKTWLRQTAIDYLNNEFDIQRWYDDPIVSMVNGEALLVVGNSTSTSTNCTSDDDDNNRIMQETKNALGQVNGRQILASPSDISRIQQHISHISSTYNASASSLHQQQKQQTTTTDLRAIVRQIEEDLFTLHSGFLIIHQCVDFQKQDGITEMEEAIQANVVERRLNDQLLLLQEADDAEHVNGILQINRQPIYVSCVSNFTNFLDLSRKTLRSLEVGIPVIILSRTNTSQHAFRWTQLLIQLGKQYNLPANMITYVSASLEDIVTLTQSTSHKNTTGNLYATCSRTLARTMNLSYNNGGGGGDGGKVIASTGGPNTLVLTMALSNRASAVQAHHHKSKTPSSSMMMNDDQQHGNTEKEKQEEEQEQDKAWSRAIRNAIRTSATIESSGQCTALRHAVVPTNTDMNQVHQVFEKGSVTLLPSGAAPEAMQKQQFDAVFEKHAGSVNPPTTTTDDDNNNEYHYQESADAYYKLSNTLPTGDGDSGGDDIPEYWRKVVVDFTRLDVSRNAQHLQQLIEWLNQHQPISLAINGPRQEAFQLAFQLFDKTALVVYTIGSTDHVDTMPPALTCQARPQDGEVFGEFPPRFPLPLRTFTKFPVIVPSSNPSYDATYRIDYLKQQGTAAAAGALEYFGKTTRTLLEHVQDDAIRGYCIVLIRYLQNVDASRNPKVGFGNDNRTALWGLQRPPLGSKTYVHVAADTPWDAIAPLYILFHVTTARDQIELSIDNDIDNSNEALIALCRECKLAHTIETKDEMTGRLKNNHHGKVFAVESLTSNDVLKDGEFYMAGQFTSLYLPLGHIKSTMPNDEEFLFRARAQTNKWLSTLF